MHVLLMVVAGLVIVFGFVVFFGAPYLPTMRRQTETALDMLDLKKGQTLLELGSGDGRFLLAAARRGIKSVGYELNPLLVIWTLLISWRYRKLVSVKWGNYWSVQWPPADGMYVFLLQKYMNKLDKKVMQYVKENGKCNLVSFAFTIPGKKPKAQKDGLSLYEYKQK